MSLTFRTVAIAVIVIGIAMGVSFGAGAAYGRGDKPKAAAAGLTSQQITQLYGAPTGGGAAAAAGGAGGTGASGPAGANAAGGAAALLGGASVGRITGVSGQTLTIQTAAGASVKLNMAGSTTVNRVTSGAASDLKEGTIVVARGTRKDDGSIDITSISQVPPELQSLGGANAASPTPTR